MIATLNGTSLMVGNMRVASIVHSPNGFKWHAIFGGGRTGRAFFPTFTQAIRACAKTCGLTVRVPASWEEVRVTFESDELRGAIEALIQRAIDYCATSSIYGEDQILAAIQKYLRDSTFVENMCLYIHRGGHHVAICVGNDRLAMITAEDSTL